MRSVISVGLALAGLSAALLVGLREAPAMGQGVWPSRAGDAFCRLRRSGVPYREAMRVAIRENMAPGRYDPLVDYPGVGLVNASVLVMVDYIQTVCPEALRREGQADV